MGMEDPVACSNVMDSQQFVMISKAYSNGISVWKVGPRITKEFGTVCNFNSEKSFRTAGTFVKKFVPKHYVTTLTVADDLTYTESIAFERRTVMKNFSETTNIFLPKVSSVKYCSTLLFVPNAIKRNYITGVELCPAQKFVVVEEISDLGVCGAKVCREKLPVNGDINGHQLLINGEV